MTKYANDLCLSTLKNSVEHITMEFAILLDILKDLYARTSDSQYEIHVSLHQRKTLDQGQSLARMVNPSSLQVDNRKTCCRCMLKKVFIISPHLGAEGLQKAGMKDLSPH